MAAFSSPLLRRASDGFRVPAVEVRAAAVSEQAARCVAALRGPPAGLGGVDPLVAVANASARPARDPVTAELVSGASSSAAALAKAAVGSAATASYLVRATAVARSHTEAAHELLVARTLRDARCDDDGLGFKGEEDAFLKGLLEAAYHAMQRRYAVSTTKLDASYWRMWEAWCSRMGTPPLRVNEQANSGLVPALHRREVALSLGYFMTCVAEASLRNLKISSMLARLRGVARRHSAVGLRFVSLSLVVQAAKGLVQEHIDTHGAEALEPRSKEPFTTAEIEAMLDLPVGTVVAAGVVVGDNIAWQGVRVFIALYCTAGFRKEAIAIGSGEAFGPRKLSLAQMTYRLAGTLTRAPSLVQLLAIADGDMSYTTTVPCKNDPENKKFGATPIPSRYDRHRRINFCREIARYEVMRMQMAGVERWELMARKLAPLVLSPAGISFSKTGLDALFKALIRCVPLMTEERARQLSVHSFRVWLACALLAAGATPDQILMLVRWSSEAAKALYARLADTTAAALLDASQDAAFTSIRSHTLLQTLPALPTAATATAEQLAARPAHDKVAECERLLSSVTIGGAATATAAQLHARASIDDDAVYAAIRQSSDVLEARAAQADASLGSELVDEDEDPEDES